MTRKRLLTGLHRAMKAVQHGAFDWSTNVLAICCSDLKNVLPSKNTLYCGEVMKGGIQLYTLALLLWTIHSLTSLLDVQVPY